MLNFYFLTKHKLCL